MYFGGGIHFFLNYKTLAIQQLLGFSKEAQLLRFRCVKQAKNRTGIIKREDTKKG